MSPSLPTELFDLICSELYADLWSCEEHEAPRYQAIVAFDVHGNLPFGNWLEAWQALQNLRLSSKALHTSASRFYFRRLEVDTWTEFRSPVLKLWHIAESAYAGYVEELKFIQWPNAETGDHEAPNMDPEFRALSEWNRETLRMCCQRFPRLRVLEMDHTGFHSPGEKDEEPDLLLYTPFWKRVLSACPPTLRELSYTSPVQDKWEITEDSSNGRIWQDEEADNRWSDVQLRKLSVTFGQYFMSSWWRPKFPAPIGIRGLQELELNYIGHRPKFGLPAKVVELASLRSLALDVPLDDSHIDCAGWDLARLLQHNEHTLKELSLQKIDLTWKGRTWTDVLSPLMSSTALRKVRLRTLAQVVDDRRRLIITEMCTASYWSSGTSTRTFQASVERNYTDLAADARSNYSEGVIQLDVAQALLKRADKNASNG